MCCYYGFPADHPKYQLYLPKCLSRFIPSVVLCFCFPKPFVFNIHTQPLLSSQRGCRASNSIQLYNQTLLIFITIIFYLSVVPHSFMALLIRVFSVNLQHKCSEGKIHWKYTSKGCQFIPFAALIAVDLPWQNIFTGLSAYIFSLHVHLVKLTFLAL